VELEKYENFELLNNNTSNILRCLEFLEKILDKTENNGIEFLKSMSQLTKGKTLTFHITNEIVRLGKNKKFEIKIDNKKTIKELRDRLATKLHLNSEQLKLKLYPQNRIINQGQNSKSIFLLGLNDG